MFIIYYNAVGYCIVKLLLVRCFLLKMYYVLIGNNCKRYNLEVSHAEKKNGFYQCFIGVRFG